MPDDQIVVQVDDVPAAPAVTAAAPPAPAIAAPSAPPKPAPAPFDPQRLDSFLDSRPEAMDYLRRRLGIDKLENENALKDACLQHGVDPGTAGEYRELLVGQTPDETRAKVEKFAKLRATLPVQQAATPAAGATPVAPASAPQYQAPPPLQTAPAKPPDISKMSYEDQVKLLTEVAAKEW